MSNPKKLYIKTYGCQMNVYDSGRMADILGPLGFESIDGPEEADMVILNTCHIREKAEEKVFSDLGRLKPFKTANEKMVLAVAGCTAQAQGDEIMRRVPFVDMVFGPQTYHRLPEMIAELARKRDARQGNPFGPGRGILDVDFPLEPKFDFLPENPTHVGVTAFLAIQEGCDKFCHFCCVPYTRGAEYSRPVKDLIVEAQKLLDQGAREITLLGQNVNAYHGIGPNGVSYGLAELMEALSPLPGLKRMRYMTSHPRDMNQRLLDCHRDVPNVMPFLHLPVQSGSDSILKAMNRKHTVAEYLDIIERARIARPDMGFSSDFIVGYPGETDQDFEATLELIRQVRFSQSYSFKYSMRPGTPAASLSTQIPEDVKDARLKVLQALILEQQDAFNDGTAGKILPVLFEKKGRMANQWLGKTPQAQPVHVIGTEDLIGTEVNVKILRRVRNGLEGQLI